MVITKSPNAEVRFQKTRGSGALWWVVGFILLLSAICMGIWGFALGSLSPDQRQIFSILMGLAGGFAAGSFTGAMRVNSRNLKWVGSVSASSGFAVYILTFFGLFSGMVSTFSLPVYVDSGHDSYRGEGFVVLQLESGPLKQRLEQGYVQFHDIPGKFEGKTAFLIVYDASNTVVTKSEVTIGNGRVIRVSVGGEGGKQ